MLKQDFRDEYKKDDFVESYRHITSTISLSDLLPAPVDSSAD